MRSWSHRALLFVVFGVFAHGAIACRADEPASEPPPVAAAAASAAPVPQGPATLPQSLRPMRSSGGPVGYDGPLPPIPTSPHAGATPDVVRAVYEFAARRPDVMRHVPCFCGCERNGHTDNEDCFVASRGADGKPQWDAHGLT